MYLKSIFKVLSKESLIYVKNIQRVKESSIGSLRHKKL